MSLAQDLMGLGENPIVAARLASGGVGPVSITVTGTTTTGVGPAAQTPIYGTQYIVSVTAISGGGVLILPAAGSASANPNSPLIYDDFVIHNATTGSLTILPPAGTTLNIGGTAFLGIIGTNAPNPFTLTTLKTLTFWTGPTATQWFGLSA
jgi:hypothetical protein